MKTEIWRAIDWIGYRPAARMDWETASGLPWRDLAPFFVAIPGRLAREAMDPDAPGMSMVVWEKFHCCRCIFCRPRRECTRLSAKLLLVISQAFSELFGLFPRGEVALHSFPGFRN